MIIECLAPGDRVMLQDKGPGTITRVIFTATKQGNALRYDVLTDEKHGEFDGYDRTICTDL